MPDRSRGREVAGVQCVGHQPEGNRPVRQSRRLIHQLVAISILDPETALIRADPVHRAFMQLAPFAVFGLIH
jgi:hypothetical protein